MTKKNDPAEDQQFVKPTADGGTGGGQTDPDDPGDLSFDPKASESNPQK